MSSAFLRRHGILVKNFGQLGIERLFRAGISLLVSVWVARYLGPEEYGHYSYAMAIFLFFSTAAKLGLGPVVIKEISQSDQAEGPILSAALGLRLLSAAAGLVLSIGLILALPGSGQTALLVLIILGQTFFWEVLEVFDYWFQAKMNLAPLVAAKIWGLSSSAALKVALILLQAPVYAFALAFAAEFLVCGSLMAIRFFQSPHRPQLSRLPWAQGKALLSESWTLALAGLSSLLYARLDQIMIAQYLTPADVGLYAVSSKIVEIPMLLTFVGGTVLYPKLARMFQEDRSNFWQRYEELTLFYTAMAIGIVAIFWPIGGTLVTLMFGKSYAPTASIVVVHIFTLIFSFNAWLRSSYLVLAGLGRVILWSASLAALFNLILNLFFIPEFGVMGAVVASIMTQALSLWLLNLMVTPTRSLFWLQTRSLLLIPALLRSLKRRRPT